MTKHQNENGICKFNLKKDCVVSEIFVYKDEQILEPLGRFAEISGFAGNDNLKKNELAEEELGRSLRVCRMNQIYDTLTFAVDFMEDVDGLLDLFGIISEDRIFLNHSTEKSSCLSSWFDFYEPFSMAQWIVSQFEMRILRFFYKKDTESVFLRSPVFGVDILNEFWGNLKVFEKEELVLETCKKVKKFRKVCFEKGDFSVNFPVKEKLNSAEKIIKWIFSSKFGFILTAEKTKEDFSGIVRRKLAELSENFFSLCNSIKLEEVFCTELFFLNCLSEEIENKSNFKLTNLNQKINQILPQKTEIKVQGSFFEEKENGDSHHSTFISESEEKSQNSELSLKPEKRPSKILTRRGIYFTKQTDLIIQRYIAQVLTGIIEICIIPHAQFPKGPSPLIKLARLSIRLKCFLKSVLTFEIVKVLKPVKNKQRNNLCKKISQFTETIAKNLIKSKDLRASSDCSREGSVLIDSNKRISKKSPNLPVFSNKNIIEKKTRFPEKFVIIEHGKKNGEFNELVLNFRKNENKEPQRNKFSVFKKETNPEKETKPEKESCLNNNNKMKVGENKRDKLENCNVNEIVCCNIKEDTFLSPKKKGLIGTYIDIIEIDLESTTDPNSKLSESLKNCPHENKKVESQGKEKKKKKNGKNPKLKNLSRLENGQIDSQINQVYIEMEMGINPIQLPKSEIKAKFVKISQNRINIKGTVPIKQLDPKGSKFKSKIKQNEIIEKPENQKLKVEKMTIEKKTKNNDKKKTVKKTVVPEIAKIHLITKWEDEKFINLNNNEGAKEVKNFLQSPKKLSFSLCEKNQAIKKINKSEQIIQKNLLKSTEDVKKYKQFEIKDKKVGKAEKITEIKAEKLEKSGNSENNSVQCSQFNFTGLLGTMPNKRINKLSKHSLKFDSNAAPVAPINPGNHRSSLFCDLIYNSENMFTTDIKISELTQTDNLSNSPNSSFEKFTNIEIIKERIEICRNKLVSESLAEIHTSLNYLNAKVNDDRLATIQKIRDIVQISFKNPQISVVPYGSFETGLLTPYSDIDLAIQGCQSIEKTEAIKVLELLEHNLKLSSFVKKSTLILTSSVPILKIECDVKWDSENSGPVDLTKIDIIVSLNEELGMENTALRTTAYIHKSIFIFKTFFLNVLVLKFILNSNNYSNSYTGCLNRGS